MRRAADSDLGAGRVAGRAVAIREEKQVLSGEIFGFEYGPLVAA